MLLFDRLARRVGIRYLTAKKESSFLSVISFISVGGVAVGVLAMVVVLSVMAGFEHEMKKRLFQAETHVRVEQAQGVMDNRPELIEKVRAADKRIQSVFPVLQTEVILKSGRRVGGAVLKGVGTPQLDRIKEQVAEWAPSGFLVDKPSRIFVGQELAFELGLVPGDSVTAISPVEKEGPMGSVPRVKQFVVEGVFKTGVPEQELHDVFTPTANVESFLRERGILTQLELRVDTLENAPYVTENVSRAVGGDFLVRSWQDMNEHLFASLKLERAAMSMMLAFIVVVAAFNILSVLTMTVIEKKKSLSILRAMGATRKQIADIVLWQGLTIAAFGSLIGASFGLAVCILLKRYPIIQLPDFYYDRTLPVLIQPMTIVVIVAAASIIVLVGAYIPARKAMRLTPLAGIKE